MRNILLASAVALPLALIIAPASAQTPKQPVGAGQVAPGPTSPMPGGGSGGDARGGELGANQAPTNEAAPGTADTMPPSDQVKPRKVETSPPASGKSAAPDANRADKPAEMPKGGTQSKQAGDTKATGKKELTADNRRTIKQTIIKENVRPVTNINFSLTVGHPVPRSVEMHIVPATVVEIYPEYRGYRFFVLADGRIVIVEPDTFEIVTIIAG